MIYFDNNATSHLSPIVAEKMTKLSHIALANPSSQHAAGRAARRIVEDARDRLLKVVDARTQGMTSDQLFFTSGGTEANNLAIFGLSESHPGRILVSSIEHPSILSAGDRLASLGKSVERIQVLPSGVIDLEHLHSLLQNSVTHSEHRISIVSVMAANNETGIEQPIENIVSLCRKYSVLVHCDAVQALGKAPISFRDLGLDAMTITAHKIHGPIGVGALVVRHGLSPTPVFYGGFQQQGIRPGTESPLLADAFATAAELVQDVVPRSQQLLSLRNRLEQGIKSLIEGAVILGENSPRLPHTTSVSFPGIDRQALQVALDIRGLACSTGSACASGSSQPSHVLIAMGLDDAVVKGGIRLSLSVDNTEHEIDEGLDILSEAVKQLKKASSRTSRKS